MTDKGRYLNEFVILLQRFTIEQLIEIVFEELDVHSIEDIKIMLMHDKLPLTKNSVVKMFVHKNLTTKSVNWLKENLHVVRNLYIALHHHRRKWLAFQLCERVETVYSTCTTLQETIESAFFKLRRVMEVGVTKYDSMYWISLLERTHTRGRSVVRPPVSVGYILGQPYFFISINGRNEEILKVISKSFGYTKSRDCRLYGQDIKHLYRFLKIKETGASSAQEVLKLKEYIPEAPKGTERGIDFIQKAKKYRYIDSCFPNEPTLQELSVTNVACAWRVQDSLPEMAGKTFEAMELILKSPNMMKLLNELGRLGCIPLPFPEYVITVQRKATNILTLHNNNNSNIS